MPLTDEERAILDFERTWWTLDGPKATLLQEHFALSAERYYQVLNELLERPEALEHDPLVVRRLLRLRDRKRRARLDALVPADEATAEERGVSRPAGRDRSAAARSASMAGRGVFVVAVAAGIGLLVLKNGFDDGGTTAGPGATTTAAITTTTASGTTAPTTVPATAPYTVLVANGSGLPGVAGKTTTFLASKGITTLKAVDANTSDVPETVVYFTEGYQAQAQAVAQQLGGVQVAGLVPNPPPVVDLGGANVLVVVGKKPIPGVTA